MKRLLLVLMLLAAPAAAQEKVFAVYGGANVISFDGVAELPRDFEIGGTGRASLSPHISLVGSTFYGIDNSYLRGTAGVRITATDVDNRDFSVGLGAEYQASSEPDLRPEEWTTTVSLGWRPWPDTQPKLILGAGGFYGLDSNQAGALFAVRYLIGSF
jgi:hypothetical protein